MTPEDQKPTILIAEDEEVTRELISGIISAHGYATVAVANGAEALAVVRGRKIDLAVIDQMMEPMGGIEFARAMRSEGIRIPAIMVTAHDVSDLLLVAWRAGIASVLKKPLDTERLIDAVERALRWGKGR